MTLKYKLQVLIYLSSLMLAAGLFLPLTSFPVYGVASYYRIAEIESWMIIAFTLIAPGLILAGKEKWSILSVLGVWGVLLYPAIRHHFQSSNDTVLNRMGSELTSAMVDFSADLFFNIAEFHWGGFVLLTGLLVFTSAGILYRINV